VLGFRTLDEVTPQLCGKFRDDLLTRVSRVLANTVLMCLNGILAQAVADGSITVNPAAEVMSGLGLTTDARSSARSAPLCARTGTSPGQE